MLGGWCAGRLDLQRISPGCFPAYRGRGGTAQTVLAAAWIQKREDVRNAFLCSLRLLSQAVTHKQARFDFFEVSGSFAIN